MAYVSAQRVTHEREAVRHCAACRLKQEDDATRADSLQQPPTLAVEDGVGGPGGHHRPRLLHTAGGGRDADGLEVFGVRLQPCVIEPASVLGWQLPSRNQG